MTSAVEYKKYLLTRFYIISEIFHTITPCLRLFKNRNLKTVLQNFDFEMINLNLKVHVPFNFLQSYTSNKKYIVFSQFFQSRDKRAHIKNIFLKGGNQKNLKSFFFFFLKIVTKNRLLSIIICTRNERKKY